MYWELPRSPKEGRCFPLASTLRVFCRVPADEAGLISVTTKSELLFAAGLGLRGQAATEAAKGNSLKMSVISSKQTCSEYISLGNESAESSSPEAQGQGPACLAEKEACWVTALKLEHSSACLAAPAQGNRSEMTGSTAGRDKGRLCSGRALEDRASREDCK